MREIEARVMNVNVLSYYLESDHTKPRTRMIKNPIFFKGIFFLQNTEFFQFSLQDSEGGAGTKKCNTFASNGMLLQRKSGVNSGVSGRSHDMYRT
jgi:hypothetical protein